MRKSIIALTLALVLAVSGSVFAAGINFDGSLKTNLEWHRDLDGTITTKPTSELNLNFGLDTADDKTRAVVEFGIGDKNSQGLDLKLDANNLVLKKAYIETDGSFWHGGPEATTRFGSLDIDYGPFSTVKNQYGISVSGMNIGPVAVNGFYGIPTEEHKSIQGIRADMSMDNLAAGTAVIYDWDSLHMVVDGAVRPMKDLVLGGSVAAQLDLEDVEEGEERPIHHMLAVGAQYQVMDNVSVHGGYKAISEEWKPAYIADKAKKDRGQNWIHEDSRRDSGFYAGIAAEHSGIQLAADYDQMFDEAVLSAATNVEGFNVNVETVLAVNEGIKTQSTNLAVDRAFAVIDGLDVTAKYNGEWTPGNGLIHTVGADTKLGLIPAVKGLELNSEVTISDLETIGYEVGAAYDAPNGIGLSITHVGGKFADESIKTGTTAKAGIAVKF
ncbi:MAG TPA: hypothetical protein GX019_02855 [Firmicutes bacterium]|nr:hypothetical protein [Bacillota bacterium]